VEWVQTTGKTVDEAKERALDELGVDDRDAEFEVLEEPRSGLFGFTRAEARVRARVKPTAPRPKQERGRRRSGAGSGGSGGGRSRSGGGNGGRDRSRSGGSGGGGGRDRSRSGGGSGRSDGRDRDRDRKDGDSSGEERAERSRDDAADRDSSRGGGRGGGRSGNGGRDRDRDERPRERSRSNDDRPKEDKGEPMTEASVQEQATAAEEFLSGLVGAFGLDGTVTSEEVDEAVEVRIEGDDLGLLIGPKGRTLWAIQELTKTVVQRQQGGGLSTRIRVDVAGYREKRKAALERFTQDAAAAVLESGQARALEPMGAADRKVVHDAVNDIDGVATRSEGEDPRRKVVIVPE